MLRQLLKFSVDESRRPFQTLRTMLCVRDALAHGKTETLVFDGVIWKEPSDAEKWPEPKWKRLCSLVNTKRMVVDAEAIVRDFTQPNGFLGGSICRLGA